MKPCCNLIGQMIISLILIGYILSTCCVQAEDAINGEFGAPCSTNSDCQLEFVCLADKCACDKSFIYNYKGKCKKICQGTEEGLVRIGNFENQYNRYKSRYTNCTYVDGNLEITSLEGDFDLGFLKDIEEVEGYVLIVDVFSNYLNLTSLRIIRGNTLFNFKDDGYSLYIALNNNPREETQGLLELQFTSLSEIVRGGVYFHNNNKLCFATSINWEDINTDMTPPVNFVASTKLYDRRQCPVCDDSCYNPVTDQVNCWGSGPEMCQKLNYVKPICSLSCDGRCFGDQQNECCHPECAAGCDGPLKTQCHACKNFYNDGACHPFCPQRTIYDQTQMKLVPNPDGRYSFGSLCVIDCPNYLVKDGDACVIKCPPGKAANKLTNECEECNGPCPKVCPGIPSGGFLDSANIQGFKDCTVVDGNLMILKVSFTGDPHENKTGIKVADLQLLKDIREINGYLTIQEVPAEVKNLSFLSGLETIYGRHLSGDGALTVLKMGIDYLGLTSLRQILRGEVVIAANFKLCYMHNLNMSLLFSSPTQSLRSVSNNNRTTCELEGKKCHEQCSAHGCWGPGPDKCLQCRNVRVASSNTCLGQCSNISMLYDAGNNTCKQCHPQCAEGCSGPGADQCFQCKQVKVLGLNNTSECMTECPRPLKPPYLYPDSDKICRNCDDACDEGCTGPSTAVKWGGCNTCMLAINRTSENDTVRCLPMKTEFCPSGYYEQQFRSDVKDHPLTKKNVCQPCDYLCLECNGPGNANCPKCRHFSHYVNRYIQCLDKCPTDDTYPWNGHCESCHEQCLHGCTGPNITNCHYCLNYKVYLDQEINLFECVEKCPENLPHLVADLDPDKPTINVCASDKHPVVMAKNKQRKKEELDKILSIALPICGGVLILGVLLALFGYYWRQRERAKENTIKLTAKMTGVVDTEPLTPTDAKPDLSKLRLIRESELRRGGIIGSGAFGTVYKGFWIPDAEMVKIPVAIKVLQEGTSPNQNQELLEEARVMASVDHPCCIRILAVCMASQMMLITQLMPLGCLLDYIRKHKDNTGSKSLLNWCTQIARGMGYLEERGIVHRDLAARNVLVQSAGQVKITDFGLAKLLDYNEEEYHAAGGKMPIKWLALECIQNRIFTHKSDVWSYGVTAWELFMYGARPYENVRARDVPDLLEKGERLPQPPICTIDVYMIMIKCWMLDADSRPSFTELAEEFAKMSRDPGRYLVIAGDELKKIPSEEILDDVKGDILNPGTLGTLEGDKLMRLPSYSYDKDDLARHLSVAAEGPEEVIEADEYLQPAPPIPLEGDNNNVKTPLLSTSPGACGREPQLIREKRYGHLESAAAARQQRELSPSNRLRGDSINGRYSSDPVKYHRNRDDVDGSIFRGPQMGNGNVPSNRYYGEQPQYEKRSPPVMQLPIDEDDYLQPKSSNPKAYLDLENNKDYYLNEKQMEAETSPSDNYLVPKPTVQSMFENPEYFEGDPRDNVFNKPNNNIHSNNSVKPKIAPKPKRLTDYYNDVGLTDEKTHGPNRPLLSTNCSNDESRV